MALFYRGITRAMLIMALAISAAGEEGSIERLQGLDRVSSEQGWQILQATYDLGKIPKGPTQTSVLAHTAGGTRLLTMASATPGRQPGTVTFTVAPLPSPDSSNAALRQKLQADLAENQRYFRNAAIIETVAIVVCAGTIVARTPIAIPACAAVVVLGVGMVGKHSEIQEIKNQLKKLGN